MIIKIFLCRPTQKYFYVSSGEFCHDDFHHHNKFDHRYSQNFLSWQENFLSIPTWSHPKHPIPRILEKRPSRSLEAQKVTFFAPSPKVHDAGRTHGHFDPQKVTFLEGHPETHFSGFGGSAWHFSLSVAMRWKDDWVEVPEVRVQTTRLLCPPDGGRGDSLSSLRGGGDPLSYFCVAWDNFCHDDDKNIFYHDRKYFLSSWQKYFCHDTTNFIITTPKVFITTTKNIFYHHTTSSSLMIENIFCHDRKYFYHVVMMLLLLMTENIFITSQQILSSPLQTFNTVNENFLSLNENFTRETPPPPTFMREGPPPPHLYERGSPPTPQVVSSHQQYSPSSDLPGSPSLVQIFRGFREDLCVIWNR